MISHLNTQAEFARDLDSVLSASGAFYIHGGEFQPQKKHDAVVGVKRDAFLAKWGPFIVAAERYRFLRQRDLDTIHKGGVFAGQTPANLILNGEDLDSAVDAERAAQATAGGPAR